MLMSDGASGADVLRMDEALFRESERWSSAVGSTVETYMVVNDQRADHTHTHTHGRESAASLLVEVVQRTDGTWEGRASLQGYSHCQIYKYSNIHIS